MKVTVKHIQETVAEHFHVSPELMKADRLHPCSDAHLPRHVAMFFSRTLAHKSYLDIAQRFNRKDHTTARFAKQKIERMREEDAAFAEDIQQLEMVIESSSAVYPQDRTNPANSGTFMQFSSRS